MGPEISQFLSGMKKTIEQVVMPELNDRFAQEQAGIVAATLGFLETIHDKVFHYELLENQLYKQLLVNVVAVIENDSSRSEKLEASAESLKQHFKHDPIDENTALRTYPFIRASNEVMKEHLCDIIQQQPEMSKALRDQFETLIKPFFKDIELRERTWVKGLGFDSEADQLPDIDELLYQDNKLALP